MQPARLTGPAPGARRAGAARGRRAPRSIRWILPLAAAASQLFAPAPARAQAVPGAERPAEKVADWRVDGRFVEGEDLSGLACSGERVCVAASDETTGVQIFEIAGDRRLVAGAYLDLLRSNDEIDVEAVAFADDRFYAAGSHGVSRKKAERQPNRYMLVRLALSVVAEARPLGATELRRWDDAETASLYPLIKADPLLGPHTDVRLQDNGVNLEGLAVKDGTLYAGFRGPSLDGRSAVLVVDERALFAGTSATASVRTIRLGHGIGIRDLVATREGFLVLSGDAGVEPYDGHHSRFTLGHPARLHFWDGRGETVETLATLESGDGQAEGVLLLEETEAGFRVLVIHDGARNGRPVEYRIGKRPAT